MESSSAKEQKISLEDVEYERMMCFMMVRHFQQEYLIPQGIEVEEEQQQVDMQGESIDDNNRGVVVIQEDQSNVMLARNNNWWILLSQW